MQWSVNETESTTTNQENTTGDEEKADESTILAGGGGVVFPPSPRADFDVVTKSAQVIIFEQKKVPGGSLECH